MSFDKMFIKIDRSIFKNRNVDEISFYYYVFMLYYDVFTGKSEWTEGSVANGINSVINSIINPKLVVKPLNTLAKEELLTIEHIKREDYEFNYYIVVDKKFKNKNEFLEFNIVTIHYLLSTLNPEEFYTFMMMYYLFDGQEEIPYTLSELSELHSNMSDLFEEHSLNYSVHIFNKLFDKEIISVRFYPPKYEGWGPERRLFFDINLE